MLTIFILIHTRRTRCFILITVETCKESTDLSNQFPIIAGAEWEFTDDWDCGGNDIGDLPALPWDGSPAAIESREDCARKCLESESCVAFNYPDPGNGKCWLKTSVQKSTKLGKNCGEATHDWQFYTLIERNACTENGN